MYSSAITVTFLCLLTGFVLSPLRIGKNSGSVKGIFIWSGTGIRNVKKEQTANISDFNIWFLPIRCYLLCKNSSKNSNNGNWLCMTLPLKTGIWKKWEKSAWSSSTIPSASIRPACRTSSSVNVQNQGSWCFFNQKIYIAIYPLRRSKVYVSILIF